MRSIPVINAPSSAAASNQTFDLPQILATLRRCKWQIFLYMVCAILLGAYYVFAMATPIYTAMTKVAMQRQGEIVDIESPVASLGSDHYALNTEVAALTSWDLAESLVNEMNLVTNSEFNRRLPQPGDDEDTIVKTVLTAISDTIRSVLPAREVQPAPSEQQIREEVVENVLRSINVSNLRLSYVFEITVSTRDPALSAEVANTLVRLYRRQQIAVKYEATEDATEWLNERVNVLESELETAENSVKAYMAEADLVGPEALAALNRQLKDRRDLTDDTSARLLAQQTQVQTLEDAQRSGDRARMAAAANDPGLTQMLSRAGTASIAQAFDARYEQLVERARFEVERTKTQKAALDGSIVELTDQVERQSVELLKLEQLEREAGATRQLYEYFLGRLKETSAQQGVHRADSRILARAVVPRKPSSPRKGLFLMLSAAFGLLIGAIVVLAREMNQSTFRSPQEVEQATGMSVFAQVPKAPFSKRRRILNYLATKPTSALVEAIRNLRTSVLLSNMDNPPQVIMMTSSLPGEGKTTQSLALAQSFSGMGKKVLLIEGDIRRRTFQQYFKAPSQAGLITAVAGRKPMEEIVVHSEDLGADVLLGDKTKVNAADFFSSGRFREFLNEQRRVYDVIIIDTPPVLVVSDARVIGRLVDSVIYAVHWNRTTRIQLQEGLSSLDTVDVKVSGLVLSQVDVRKAQTYGGKYSELYTSYGSKYYHN